MKMNRKKATVLISKLTNKSLPKSKCAQEEMIGFALIIVIVTVVLLVFLGLSLRGEQKENVESYEVESFIQTFLQYTTDCRDNVEYLTIQKLIFDCNENKKCSDDRETCEVLNSTLTGIADKGWKVGEENVVKGYKIEILKENSRLLLIEEGNQTNNYKSAMQDFSRAGSSFDIYFTAYY
jgi:hypothetical protein